MPKLIITGKTLYEPIEIEIFGKSYQVTSISRPLLRKIKELDEQLNAGDLDILYEQVKLFIPKLPKEVLNKIRFEDLREIRDFIISTVFSRKQTKEEKNELRPEEERLPS